MAEKTRIGWVNRQLPDGRIIGGHTFNIVWGCAKVSEECKHCYALDIARHYMKEPLWGPAATTGRRLFGEKHWEEPLKWNRQAERDGHRHSVFSSSMADVYEEHPQLDSEREKLWKLIAVTPMLNWLLLTKRPQNVLAMSPWGRDAWPDNVWIGTSTGLQKRAEERIPALLEVPAIVRFVSAEPLLGPVDLSPWLKSLSWVIAGGESGPHFRPLNPDWARFLRDQCQAAKVLFFFKQIGGCYHTSGGRFLDGRTWDEMPPELPERVQ
jgi:protein gp37